MADPESPPPRSSRAWSTSRPSASACASSRRSSTTCAEPSTPLEQDPFVITSIFEYVSSRPIQSIILSVDLGISLLLVGCIFETLLRPSKLAFLTHPLTAAEYLLHDELLKRRKARLAMARALTYKGLHDPFVSRARSLRGMDRRSNTEGAHYVGDIERASSRFTGRETDDLTTRFSSQFSRFSSQFSQRASPGARRARASDVGSWGSGVDRRGMGRLVLTYNDIAWKVGTAAPKS